MLNARWKIEEKALTIRTNSFTTLGLCRILNVKENSFAIRKASKRAILHIITPLSVSPILLFHRTNNEQQISLRHLLTISIIDPLNTVLFIRWIQNIVAAIKTIQAKLTKHFHRFH